MDHKIVDAIEKRSVKVNHPKFWDKDTVEFNGIFGG
jgi:hypothetical protein